jgi:hypothetical protein
MHFCCFESRLVADLHNLDISVPLRISIYVTLFDAAVRADYIAADDSFINKYICLLTASTYKTDHLTLCHNCKHLTNTCILKFC